MESIMGVWPRTVIRFKIRTNKPPEPNTEIHESCPQDAWIEFGDMWRFDLEFHSSVCIQFLARHWSLDIGYCYRELWGLVWEYNLRRSYLSAHLLIEMDSLTIVNMIHMRKSNCSIFQPLLVEALSLMDKLDWACSLSHVYRLQWSL